MVKPQLKNQTNFANIPGTVAENFSLEPKYKLLNKKLIDLKARSKDLLLIYLDNFGWDIYQEYFHNKGVFNKFAKSTSVNKITSQFPSNTGGHATTIYTGLPAFMTGFYEFRIFHPKVKDIIMPLRFKRSLAEENDSLVEDGYTAEDILPNERFLSELAAAGVEVHAVLAKEIMNSQYNKYFCQDSRNYTFDNLAESLSTTGELIAQRDRVKSNFFYYYYDGSDKASHKFGPKSPQHLAELQAFFFLLEKHVLNNIKKEDFTVLVCSDHGQIEVSAETTIYLDKEIPQLEEMMAKSVSGIPLEPAGNSRDLFLHIQPQFVEEADKLLKNKLAGFATVFTQSEFIQAGYFGDPPTDVLTNFADIVVLPQEKNNVAWAGKNNKVLEKKGMHGGAHPNEMFTPLIHIDF
jgi:predicted AlkP superfamily pyrophosphatase or phosphodiesterase